MTPVRLLSIDDLRVRFPAEPEPICAVDGVSLGMQEGETLALVGESGSGKSTLAHAVMGLLPHAEGTIRFRGQELPPLGPKRRPFLRKIQMVFQDPDASLNPRLTVSASLEEALRLAAPGSSRSDLRARASKLLADVGLEPAHGLRYPHELSGGQKQRVCIARCLSVDPQLLVCDEAVSALDVSVQAQILNLLSDLRDQRSLSYLFITHDLRVVRHLATRVAVMHRGKLVEMGETARLFSAPSHPYTERLLASVPSLDPSRRESGSRAATGAGG